jgi:hypothetical protein
MVTNVMAMATTWVMALATTWRATKWAMAMVTRAIVTNAVAAVAAVALVLTSTVGAAVFIAAAATTIAQRRCSQRSHCSGCRHRHPLLHRYQMTMALVMAKVAMATATRVVGEQWQWQQHAQF